ncbi:MAG: hypothetical protein WBG32_23530 [Nodosilinea sp.]
MTTAQTQSAIAFGIYKGVDLTELRYQSAAGRSLLILSVFRLVEKKGISQVGEACDRQRQRGVEFTCQMVSVGPPKRELRSAQTRPKSAKTILAMARSGST